MANYSVNCGTLYGYANGNTSYGAFTVYFDYDSVTRSGTSVTITNACVRCVGSSTQGYTTNTIYINSCSVEGTSLGLSCSFNGKTYYKSSYSTSTVTKTITVAASDTSLAIAINGGRTAATSAQNFSGSISVAAGNYTVSYNANGGSGAPSSQTKTHDVTLTLSSTKPTRSSTTSNGYTVTFNANGGTASKSSATPTNTTSYSFKNWNTNSSGTGTSYSPGGSYTANASATLYAQWNSSTTNGSITTATATRSNATVNGYTITFDANGGVCSTTSLTQKNVNSYSFKQWNTNTSGTGTSYSANASMTPSAATTLYAIWNISTTTGTITLPTPSRGDYTFEGWGTSSTATTGVTGTYTPTSTRTLYAVWKKIPRLINWRDSNGNFTSGGTISVRDSNGNWVVIDKINIRNSSGEFEEH